MGGDDKSGVSSISKSGRIGRFERIEVDAGGVKISKYQKD